MSNKLKGNIRKMHVTGLDPVMYQLVFYVDNKKTADLDLNPFIGKKLTLSFTGKINCISCNRNIKKTFGQGYCYPCYIKLASCDSCILKPHLCHYHKGTCREPKWGEENCFIPHIVYLANTSGVKVGITRETQVPIRWCDQGATQALPIIRVQSRYQSGLIEEEISKHMADKTNWRKMLSRIPGELDLVSIRNEILSDVQKAIQKISGKFEFGDIEVLLQEKVVEINYPVTKYPEKIKSHNFDKEPITEGILQGIKGQYLIFDTGVINARKFTGYEVEVIN